MTKLIWIELDEPERATGLAEALASNGMHADTSRTLRGRPEVRIEKPRLRRTVPFMHDVEAIVRRWLARDARDVPGLLARSLDGDRVEIRNPARNRVAHPVT
jgi:hypothetical protein